MFMQLKPESVKW